MECIYCKKTDEETSFNKSEHIIPQSFGKFNDNLTLSGIVCDDCNQFFGDTLERPLARETKEGLQRFELGIKGTTEFKNPGRNSRQLIQLAEGPNQGAYAYREYSEKTKKIELFPAFQIGLLKKNSDKYEFFLNSQFVEKNICKEEYNTDAPLGIVFIPETNNEAIELLKQKGINFKLSENIPEQSPMPKKINCDVTFTIDSNILRAYAKIAFNYLIYTQGLAFSSHIDFDIIKKYILTGKKPDYPLVVPSNEAILGDESESGLRRSGHIIALDWADDNISILCRIALCNDTTYKVSLSRNFTGKHNRIRSGHFFNLADKNILKIDKKTR